MKSILKTLCVIGIIFQSTTSFAQFGGWGGDGGSDAETEDSDGSDTTSYYDGDESDDSGDGGGWGSSWGSSDGAGDMGGSGFQDPAPYKLKLADYKRFAPPYDTNREIIFYEGVVEDYDCMECASDSLYYRAKEYLISFYGKSDLKSYTVVDKKMEKIELLVRKPMLIRYNKHSKVESGMIEYKVTIQFRDARYKYQFGNFVHEESMPGNKNRTSRTYHEYYMNNKKGVAATDRYLLTADREVKDMVKGLKKALKEPYNPIEAGEDDW